MLSPSDEIAAIAELLAAHSVPFALIGGWAVISWGFVRASDDIDFLIDVSPSKRRELLAALGKDWKAEWAPGGDDDPLVGIIRAEPKGGGLPVDLLLARNAADRKALSRAKVLDLAGARLPLISPEDLIAMKLEAGGGQDYEDVRRLLELLGDKLDSAALDGACEERRVADRLALARARPPRKS